MHIKIKRNVAVALAIAVLAGILSGCGNKDTSGLIYTTDFKAEDFVDIPAYLLSLVPEYKLYYRHYSLYKYETILYAMI